MDPLSSFVQPAAAPPTCFHLLSPASVHVRALLPPSPVSLSSPSTLSATTGPFGLPLLSSSGAGGIQGRVDASRSGVGGGAAAGARGVGASTGAAGGGGVNVSGTVDLGGAGTEASEGDMDTAMGASVVPAGLHDGMEHLPLPPTSPVGVLRFPHDLRLLEVRSDSK